eukprot:2142220-Rhodomonas_salina.2
MSGRPSKFRESSRTITSSKKVPTSNRLANAVAVAKTGIVWISDCSPSRRTGCAGGSCHTRRAGAGSWRRVHHKLELSGPRMGPHGSSQREDVDLSSDEEWPSLWMRTQHHELVVESEGCVAVFARQRHPGIRRGERPRQLGPALIRRALQPHSVEGIDLRSPCAVEPDERATRV